MSPGWPSGYSGGQQCTARGIPAVPLRVLAFSVEPSDVGESGAAICQWDYLTVGGKRFCGTSGPDGAVPSNGVIRWKSDAEWNDAGWKICWGGGLQPASPPTPPPPLLPPQKPKPPQPPQSPPLMMSTMQEIRSGIARAVDEQTSLSIHLPAHTSLRLGGRALHINCEHIDASKNVWLNISGQGVTLDGMGRSRIFEVRGSCSLSLTGLSLVNGEATVNQADPRLLDVFSNWPTAGFREGYGGALLAQEKFSGAILLTRVNIADSHAKHFGGGIFVSAFVGDQTDNADSGLVLVESVITRCTARAGGGFFVRKGSTTIYRSEISHCNADSVGGGGVVAQINGFVGSDVGWSCDLSNASFINNAAPTGAASGGCRDRLHMARGRRQPQRERTVALRE